MFIQTEETPNPNALKFYPEYEISHKPLHFSSKEEARGVKLASKIFSIDGVLAVFYGSDFITITKSEESKWEILKPYIVSCMMDHFMSGLHAMDGFVEGSEDSYNKENYSDLENEIIEIIETRVRPSVALDGGDITFKKFEDGIVYLELKGSCSGCPSSTVTLKNGIESMLQYYVPEVLAVEAVSSEE